MRTQPKFETQGGDRGQAWAFRYCGSKRWNFRPQWGHAINHKTGEQVIGLLISIRKAFLQAGQRESG